MIGRANASTEANRAQFRADMPRSAMLAVFHARHPDPATGPDLVLAALQV
jgi:hypothetical protein